MSKRLIPIRQKLTMKFRAGARWARSHEILSRLGIGHTMRAVNKFLIMECEVGDDISIADARRLLLNAMRKTP